MTEAQTYTFVFTDLEGSTKLLQELGDDYADLLAEHHAIVRGAVSAHGGREVDNAGDGFFLTFEDPRRALFAALDIQLAFRHDGRLRVRMGVHTGVARELAQGFVGLAIHHAARVAAAAHGRQVLVTDEAKTDLDGASFLDLGSHRLKDLAHPVRVWQLAHPDLQGSFPPIRSLGVGGGNLPRPRTSFIGRSDDIERIGADLARPGLLTLTGPGGCGKTRLAIEAARASSGRVPGGAWFVELQSVTDPDDLVPAVARALQVPDGDRSSLLEHVVARLSRDPTLLVIDTCEHLIEACAEFVDEILEACPDLRIIATSRELLGVEGEVARRIPSLPAHGAAVDLFVERAQRVDPSFDAEGSRETITRICSRLDGIPLAIELAAARIRHLTPQSIEEALDDRFRVLTGSDRRAMQRHQTLDALVSWSYDLLTDQEAAALRALSVFAANFTPKQAADVAATDEETIYRLVDRSLVEVIEDGRLHLLETVRMFAGEKLASSGGSEDVRDRHAQVFTEIAERAAEGMRGADFEEQVEIIERSTPDVRAALEWTVRSRRNATALRLAAAVGWMAGTTSMGATLRQLVEEAVDLTSADFVAKAKAEVAAAFLRWTQSDPVNDFGERARRSFEAASATSDPLYAWALLEEGTSRIWQRDQAGRDNIERALEIAVEREDPVLETHARSMSAWASVYEGDVPAAVAALADARESAARSGNAYIRAFTSFWSGITSVHSGDWAGATRHYEDALPIFRRLPHKVPMQWTLDHLSQTTLRSGDIDSARVFIEEGIAVSRASGLATGNSNYPTLLTTAAALERPRDDHAQAAVYLREAVDVLEKTERPHGLVAARARLAAELAILGEVAEAQRLLRSAVEGCRGLKAVPTESGFTTEVPVGVVARSAARVVFAAGNAEEAAVLLGASGFLDESATPEPLRSTLPSELRDSLIDSFDAAIEKGTACKDVLGLVERILRP